AALDVHPQLALGQIADVPHGGDDLEVAPEILVNRLRLRRRFDDDQRLCHAIDPFLLVVAGQSSLAKLPPPVRVMRPATSRRPSAAMSEAAGSPVRAASTSRVSTSPGRMTASNLLISGDLSPSTVRAAFGRWGQLISSRISSTLSTSRA